MKKAIFICALILMAASDICADTVTFKSGKKVDGNIKSITNDTVTVEIFGVTEMTYDLAEIQEINGQMVELKPAAASASAPAAAPAPSPSLEEEIQETPAVEPKPVMLGAGAMAMIMAFLGIILAAFLAIYAFSAICLQLIAKKTGNEPAWLAWIPIANMFLACKIAGLSYLWLLAFLVPFVNVLVSIYIWYRISEARGKPGLLALLMLVPVANFVFMGYLAFSRSGSGTVPPPVKGEEPASPFQDRPYRPPLE